MGLPQRRGTVEDFITEGRFLQECPKYFDSLHLELLDDRLVGLQATRIRLRIKEYYSTIQVI